MRNDKMRPQDDWLGEELRSSARELPAAPPGLRDRIIAQAASVQGRALGDDLAEPRQVEADHSPDAGRSTLGPARGRRLVLALAGLAAAAGLIVAFTLVVWFARPPASPPVATPPPTPPGTVAPAEPLLATPALVEPSPLLAESSQAVEDLAGLAADRELTLLIQDAQFAGEQLLAAVPVPAELLPTDLPDSRPETD